MTVAYTTYLSRVLPYVRDCADLVAVNALRDAAIDFCQRSHWVEDTITWAPEIGEAIYTLTPTDAFTEVVWVKEVRFDGVLLSPGQFEWNNAATTRDWRQDGGTPLQHLAQLDMTTLRLWPAPDAIETVTALLAVAPTRDSTGAADVLYDRWAEDIAAGARARLHEQVGAPYYDIKAAEQMRRRFSHAIGRANIIRRQTPGGAEQVLRPPRFI